MGSGPSWHTVSKRVTYDLDIGELINAGDVNDHNRGNNVWNKRMPGGPRATRAVLFYRVPLEQEEDQLRDGDHEAFLVEGGYEHNRNGVLCRRDSMGSLVPSRHARQSHLSTSPRMPREH